MKLYDYGPAPNPRRVRVFLAEKGISVPRTPVDIFKGEQRAEWFTALNPRQSLPVLELDDGTAIAESIAICRYFEEIQPDPPLFGTGALGRAQVEMWQRRIELGLFFAAGAYFQHLHPMMAQIVNPRIPAWAEVNAGRAQSFLQLLEHQLHNRPFVCGEALTIADITGLVAIDFAKFAQLPLPQELPNVWRWHRALAARPSASA